jgi:hypothetical protein
MRTSAEENLFSRGGAIRSGETGGIAPDHPAPSGRERLGGPKSAILLTRRSPRHHPLGRGKNDAQRPRFFPSPLPASKASPEANRNSRPLASSSLIGSRLGGGAPVDSQLKEVVDAKSTAES